MIFTKDQEQATVEMVSWPKTTVQLPPSCLKKMAEEKDRKEESNKDLNSTTVSSGAELLALIRQGQRV